MNTPRRVRQFLTTSCAVLVCLSFLLPLFFPTEVSSFPQISPSMLHELKLRLVNRINVDRDRSGSAPVSFSEELSSVADAHCLEMLSFGYASHWNTAGMKPYMRYSGAGIYDHTAENISSYETTLDHQMSLEVLERRILERHQDLINEKAPMDLHRKSILDPHHTEVGIGVAFNSKALKLIEVFAARYIRMDKLPASAPRGQKLLLRGTLRSGDYEVYGISVFSEPTPVRQTPEQLNHMGAYGLPEEELLLRPKLPDGSWYEDRKSGVIEVGQSGAFRCPIPVPKAGICTIVVWLRKKNSSERPFMSTDICIRVD
jgi:uncharacterized protein YkwD